MRPECFAFYFLLSEDQRQLDLHSVSEIGARVNDPHNTEWEEVSSLESIGLRCRHQVALLLNAFQVYSPLHYSTLLKMLSEDERLSRHLVKLLDGENAAWKDLFFETC